MIKGKVVVANPSGLQLRTAGILCREASHFRSQVLIFKGGSTIDAKSVLNLLGASIQYGDELELSCQGQDEEEAFAVVKNLIESDIKED